MSFSFFGVISLIILIISAAALIIHHNVVKVRASLDQYMMQFEELLHDRLEIIIEIAEELKQPSICEACEAYLNADTREITKAWAKIEKITAPIKEELNKALTENAQEIDVVVTGYNGLADAYNNRISKLPGRLIAYIVGLEAVKEL